MKKIFSFLIAALFSASMFAAQTYFFKGEANNSGWVKTAMTVSDDGYYEYYQVSSNFTYQFLIGTSADENAYNGDYVSAGFNNTDVTTIGKWNDNGNCYSWSTAAHYVLVYYPNTRINADSSPKICASTTLPEDAKFYIIGINDVWEPNAIKSTTDSYTVENVSAGHHAFKISEDGTWATSKGLANITESNKYLYPDQDGNVCFYLSEAADVTITYIAGTPTFTVSSSKFALPPVKVIGDGEQFGEWVEANAKELTPAQDELTATRTFTLTKNQHAVFKMIRGGDWLTQEGEGSTNYGLKREWPSVSGLYRDGEGKKCIELAGDVAGDYIFTWTYATGTLTITFPDPTLENGFYLIGKFNDVPEWTVETLTAAKKFTWNKHIGEGNEEWKITADLHLGDQFKAAYVYLDAITEYIPAAEETKYVVTDEAQVGTMTIYFQQKYNDTWAGHFYVENPSPATGIDNNEVSAKAVKRIINGQLVIEKNGKTFNALGAEVK